MFRPGWLSEEWARRARLAAPLVVGLALGAAGAAFPPTHDAFVALYDGLRKAVLARPEFRIRQIELVGASHVSDDQIVEALKLTEGSRAALNFDAKKARVAVEKLGWVKRASVMLRPPHTVVVEIEERAPAYLWRKDGKLTLIDHAGAKIVEIASREEAGGLPLIVGPGATRALGEARTLYEMALDAKLPIVGLTRIGQRRWDVEMLSGPRLMLPSETPVAALDRAVRWIGRYALLERGFTAVDFRLPHAPMARLGGAPAALASEPVRRRDNRG